jgi:hypothetical protein
MDRRPPHLPTACGDANTYLNDQKFRYDELFCKFIYISEITLTLVES